MRSVAFVPALGAMRDPNLADFLRTSPRGHTRTSLYPPWVRRPRNRRKFPHT
jgi:hypothetical protein